jgi:hypothetical protein
LKTGAKAGAPLTAPANAAQKRREPSPAVVPAGAVVKRPTDAVLQPPSFEGPRYKPPMTALLQTPPGRGAKEPTRDIARSQERTLRLRLTMRDTGEVRLDSAVLIEGAVPDPNRVTGPFLFAVRRASGALVHFGTFSDPLVQHSYRAEDQKHDERRVPEGSFAVSLPGTLAREGLQGLTIHFYDARKVALPPVLDQKAFSAAVRKASPLRSVNGAEVNRVMEATR